MPLQKLPVVDLDNVNHRRRAREVTNLILSHQHDDSRVQTTAEKLAGVTPTNYAFPPGDVRRYGAVGDGVTNDTLALQSASAVINELGRGTLEFEPNANYLVWVGSSPDLISLSDCHGVIIRGNGATITSGRVNGPGVFAIKLDGCEKTRIEGLKLQGSLTGLTDNSLGEGLVSLLNGTRSTTLLSLHSKDANTLVGCGDGSTPPLADRVSGIFARGLVAENTYYGFQCGGNGDDADIDITGLGTGRVYFGWNVRNHRVRINGTQRGPFSDVLIKCYGYASSSVYSATENIRVSYSSQGKTSDAMTNGASDALIHLEVQLAASGGGAARLSDIDVQLDIDVVDSTVGAELNRIFNITKLDAAGASDTNTSRGHTVENVRLSGIVRNYQNSGAHSDSLAAIQIFDNSTVSGNQMNWTGDTARNIRIEDLVILDSTAVPLIAGVFVNGQPFSAAVPGLVARNLYLSNLLFSKTNWSDSFHWVEESIKAKSSYDRGLISYSPTITASGGGFSLGDGTLSGYYSKRGDEVTVFVKMIFGSTSNAGAGTWDISIPVAARTEIEPIGSALVLDAGTNFRTGVCRARVDGTARIQVFIDSAIGAAGAGVPVTWATGDEMYLTVRYRV